MAEKEEVRKSDARAGKGSLCVVGTGPGGLEYLTGKAKEAILNADCIVGYTRYVDLIAPLTTGKEVFSTGMTHEVERCSEAIRLAKEGRKVAVISSGDSGIYGMAGLVLELLKADGADLPVEVVPGLPAFVAAASILGAPLMHDFASISLSDLLTDWEKIEARVEGAAKADFVLIFYNPKSSKRIEGLGKALDIVKRFRDPATPVGMVRNATREGEEAIATTLSQAHEFFDKIDMLTILIIGNSETRSFDGRIVTPRGYQVKETAR